MKHFVLVAALVAIAACAGLDAPPDTRIDDGVKDFITVEKLEEVDAIRRRTDLRIHNLTDYFVVVRDRDDYYLLAYRTRCRDIPDQDVSPDFRHEGKTIRARFDTLRGCRIGAIYQISEGQADELKGLAAR